MHCTFPRGPTFLAALLFVEDRLDTSEGSVYFGRFLRAQALPTWATVRGQVAVAVAVARGAAVDAAVVVVGAGVGPRVGQPGLRGGLPDVQQTGPVERKTGAGVNTRHKEMNTSEDRRPQPIFGKSGLCPAYFLSAAEKNGGIR